MPNRANPQASVFGIGFKPRVRRLSSSDQVAGAVGKCVGPGTTNSFVKKEVRGEGVEPSRSLLGSTNLHGRGASRLGWSFTTTGPRRSDTPHQTHAAKAFVLFIITSVTSNRIPVATARRANPNPNETSTTALIRAFTPKLRGPPK